MSIGSNLTKPTLFELTSPLSPRQTMTTTTTPNQTPLPTKEDIQNSKEYKSLQIQYNRILRLYTDIQNQNQKKTDDLVEYYESKISVLETRLKKEERIVS